MFLLENNELLINEIAPRPHNSGHYTIDACVTSQFEAHVRAVTGLPMPKGFTEFSTSITNAIMLNVLGDKETQIKNWRFVAVLWKLHMRQCIFMVKLLDQSERWVISMLSHLPWKMPRVD